MTFPMLLWISFVLVPALASCGQNHIWCEAGFGRGCDNCDCSSYLSDGPNDADVQVTLAGLPSSTENSSVHLSWWAARESPTEYNLLESPIGASWYWTVHDAYAKYLDSGFNGGNVRVGTDGEATLRIRSPSLYLIGPYGFFPHIHLRLCHGESSMQRSGASVEFGFAEHRLLFCSSWDDVSIKSVSKYTHNSTAVSTQSGPNPAGTIIGCADCPTTTASAATTSATTSTTTSTTTTYAMVNRVINSSMDGIDPDGWEFSPVYQCLNDNLLYSYFISNCTEDCAEGVVEVSGQCVRPSVDAGTRLTATWKLEVMCTGDCVGNKVDATLHLLRFYVAEHFNITYQETVAVSLSGDLTSRRLSSNLSAQTIYLSITIATDRVLTTLAAQLMESYIPDVDTASILLGMDVTSVEQWDGDVAGDTIAQIDTHSDPYSGEYVNLLPSKSETESTESNESASQTLFLIIICVAGGVVVMAVAIGVVICVRRSSKQVVDCNKVEDNSNVLDAAKTEEKT